MKLEPRLIAIPQATALTAGATPLPAHQTDTRSAPRVLLCVTCVAVLIMVMVGKVSEWVPGLAWIPLAKIAFLFAAIAAYRSRAVLPPVRVRSLRIARPAIAFMALAIVSVLFSIYRSNSLIASQLILILLLSMVLLLKVTQTLADVERLLAGFAAASVSLSLGLVLNYHGGRADINSNFDPNDIAYALDTSLPLLLALRPRHSRLGRLLINALVILMAVCVLLTGSRGGVIGLCVVTAAVIAFPLSRDAAGTPKRFAPARAMLKYAVVIVGVALAWGNLPTATRERVATLLDLRGDYNLDKTVRGGRVEIWQRDLQSALERPIGYGLGSAEAVDGMNGGQYRAAHNALIQVFVELGVLGLILYLYSYLVGWRYLAQVRRPGELLAADEEAQKAALYARALRVALAGNLTASLFLSQAYSPALWMLLAVAAALVRIRLPAPVRAAVVPAVGSPARGPG